MTVWAQVQLLQTWNVQPARKVDKQLAFYWVCSVIERKVLNKFVHKATLIGQKDRSHSKKIFFQSKAFNKTVHETLVLERTDWITTLKFFWQKLPTNYHNTCKVIPTLASKACWIVDICWATTDNTSTSIRLNSSKQAHAPALYTVQKNHVQLAV